VHPATVFMGDSCTQFGTYPARTLAMLRAMGSPLANGVKVGVAGWSSTQGLAQLRRDVLPLHPHVVTVYYGWNDHWVAYGMTDPEIARAHRLLAFAGVSRLAQLWLKLQTNMAARRTPRPNRVPLHDYQANLASIAREAQAAGVVAVFITAPSNHVAGHEPAYLARRHVRTLAELVPLHDEYTQATRAVAQSTGASLCDAAAAFAALPQPPDRYFQRDGIHLTEEGDEQMARVVSECLVRIK
jgi:lysophospholipase L1-like esterase